MFNESAIKLISVILIFYSVVLVKNSYAQVPCINISEIEFKSRSNYIHRQIKNSTNQYLDKCINIQDIKQIIGKITNIYIEHGYVTSRVLVPEQDLSTGKLKLDIIEGRIEEVNVEGEDKRIPPFIPLSKGKLLSLRDVEQTYDHYSRVSSNNVTIQIKPGSEKGASRINIRNEQKKRWKVNAGIDNSGSKHKGENIAFSNLTIGNLFGLNESFLVGDRRSIADHDEKYAISKNFYVSVPFGYTDLSYSYNFTRNFNLIDSNGSVYSNRGKSKIYKFDLNQLIYRNSKSKYYLTIGFGRDIYSNFLDDTKIQISSYKIAKVDFGINVQTRLKSSVLAYGLTLTSGVNDGFFTRFGDIAAPDRKFSKLSANISWFKPLPIIVFGKNIQFRSKFLGQYTSHMLASSERLTLGGLSSIRGFKKYSENSDNALQLRNELIVFLPQYNSNLYKKFAGDVSIFGAFDIGYFSNYEEFGKRHGTLSGVAVGLRNSDGVFDFDIALARPVESSIEFKKKNVLYFSLGVSI